jgi:nucleotide-binding universal stress UspA family protein
VVEQRSDGDRDRAEAYLASMVERILLLCPAKVDLAVRQGRPMEEIEAEAADWDASLVVMATHGRAGIARLWKGSVAARCVQGGTRPVMLVKPPEDQAADPAQAPFVARVVVPLDGSELAERALEPAANLARAFGVHVLLLSVRQSEPGAERRVQFDPAETDDPARTAALAYIKTQVARLRRSGIDSYGMMLNEPDPAETIADRVRGDLLVMATHGHEGFRQTLVGTVTDKVVRAASCAVMVMPPPRPDEARVARSA